MNTLFIEKRIIRTIFVLMTILLAVIAVVRMGISLFRIDVNADAAYYLGVSRLILDGKTPFLDFPPGYTPLSFYIMSVPINIWGTSFSVALLSLYLFHIINAVILYKIVRQNSGNRIIAAFCCVFSLLLCIGTDGCRYILEPFVLFFGLLALFVLKRGSTKWIILSGFLCFCSFWCKQYGLGFICLAIASIFLEEGFKYSFIRKSLYLLMGFFVAMSLFVLFFLVQGVDPLALLSLSGGNYERDGISGIIAGWKSLLITLPLLTIAIVVMLAKLKNVRKMSLLVVSFLGVFGFMLQCYVRFYTHYMMLAMPFCALMLFACINAIESIKWRNIYIIFLLMVPVIPVYFASQSILKLTNDNLREKQETCAYAIEQLIPTGSIDVYASMDLLPYMHINSYNPPLIAKYGLSNGFVRKSEEAEELIHAASYCMISERDLQKNQKYTTDVCEYLNKEFDMYQTEGIESNNMYYFYVRK